MSKKGNTKTINRKDFTTLFEFLFKITGKEELFTKRICDRMQNVERNYIFTYFAAFHPSELKQIAINQFSGFIFSSKLYQIELLSKKFINFTDEIQKLKKPLNMNNESLLDLQLSLQCEEDPNDLFPSDELTTFGNNDDIYSNEQDEFDDIYF